MNEGSVADYLLSEQGQRLLLAAARGGGILCDLAGIITEGNPGQPVHTANEDRVTGPSPLEASCLQAAGRSASQPWSVHWATILRVRAFVLHQRKAGSCLRLPGTLGTMTSTC